MNAYERENAQEWQMQDGGAIPFNRDSSDDDQDDDDDEPTMQGPHPSLLATPTPVQKFAAPKPAPQVVASTKPCRPVIRFEVEGDSAARAAWRSRKPHNDSYRLPKDYHHIVMDQMKSSNQNTDFNPSQLPSVLEAIGTRSGTHIGPPGSVRDRELLIWGNNAQVKAAKGALEEWFRRLRRVAAPQTGRAMPSVHPITNKQRKDYEFRISEAAQKQSFRQQPESGTVFAVTGAYIWPLAQIRPEEMLGANYEALDPIRMYHNCYIVYDRKSPIFKILSNVFLDVEGAIESLENAICELAARSSIPFEKYLVAPPGAHVEETNVKMLDAPWHKDNEKGTIEKRPVFVKVGLQTDINTDPPKLGDALAKRNQDLMQQTTLRCLSRMCYYRGRILMRIYIGTFELNKFRWTPKSATSVPFEQFVESMGQAGTKGTLKQVLPTANDADGLFARTCRASHLVEPVDAHTRELLDVTPLSVAFFTFQKSEQGQMKLLVETASTLGDDYLVEVTQRKWSRIDNSNSVPLQLFMIGLEGGVTWKLQVSTENTFETARLTPSMADFADSIYYRGKKEEIRNPGKPLFSFRPIPNLIEFTQKTTWRYRLTAHSAYVFEVARYETFDVSHKKLLRTHWGGSIFNEAWDQILAGNSALRMGAKGTWSPALDVFFPKNDTQDLQSNNGFGELLAILQSIIEFLSEERKVV